MNLYTKTEDYVFAPRDNTRRTEVSQLPRPYYNSIHIAKLENIDISDWFAVQCPYPGLMVTLPEMSQYFALSDARNQWCHENSGKHFIDTNTYIFEKEEDAILFSMTWL